MTALTIDLSSIDYRVNPWPTYSRLREEAPVLHLPNATWDGQDLYIVSRYDDVSRALKDKDCFSSKIRQGDHLDLPMLVNRDAPDHTRLRRLANHAFQARLVTTLGDRIQGIVDNLLATVLDQDRVDLVDQFTILIPLTTIGGMLGLPLDRKADLRRWSQAVMDSFAVAAGMDPDHVPGFYEDIMEFGNYMGDIARERQQRPPQEDILGTLVQQHEQGNLAWDELVTTAWSFVTAGHETTMNLLGAGTHLLITDLELRQRLLADPDRVPDFVEECLRMYPPTQWLLRRTLTEVELSGVTIPPGALLHVLLGSANRDPLRWDDPDRFDLDRPEKEQHLAFGAGAHFCPGGPLSRLLGDITFRTLLPVVHRFALDPADPPQLRTRQGSYGFTRMPVRVSPGAK